MKLYSLLLLLLIQSSLVAQQNWRTEVYAGPTMLRLHTRSPYINIPGETYFRSQTEQAGAVIGIRFSKGNRLFSNILSIDFQRNIAYATLQYRTYNYYQFGGPYESISDVHYMRWDATRAILSWQLQMRLGPRRDVALHAGLMFSSLLANRSRVNYWLTENQSYYDPATSSVVYIFQHELVEEKLTMRQMTGILCAGATLPIPETKFSLLFNWQFSFIPANQTFGIAERGMTAALLYRL